MSVRLRAHHLLCVLTFVGEGYSPAFITNLASIVRRIARGEPIDLVDGPDDICAPLEGTGDDHCLHASAGRRDRSALLALAENGLPIDARPLVLEGAGLDALRAAFRAGTIRAACRNCAWTALCTSVAEAGFERTSL